jgi:hypothetical protein
MFSHSNTSWFFSVLMAAHFFSLTLAGVAAAQGNTSLGINALGTNTTGSFNTAIGAGANVSAGNLTSYSYRKSCHRQCSDKIRLENCFVAVIEGQVVVYCRFGQDPERKLPAGGW